MLTVTQLVLSVFLLRFWLSNCAPFLLAAVWPQPARLRRWPSCLAWRRSWHARWPSGCSLRRRCGARLPPWSRSWSCRETCTAARYDQSADLTVVYWSTAATALASFLPPVCDGLCSQRNTKQELRLPSNFPLSKPLNRLKLCIIAVLCHFFLFLFSSSISACSVFLFNPQFLFSLSHPWDCHLTKCVQMSAP